MQQVNNLRLIAVCGGIASGKSLAIAALKTCGAQVLSCDEINRQLLNEPDYVAIIAKHFDNVVKNGVIDKATLRDIILNDKIKEELLNSLAHPRIFDRVMLQARQLGGVVFVEVPLLNASNLSGVFDKVWFIKASEKLRLDRLIQRDNLSRGDAERFIAMQSSENNIELSADCIIVNDNTYNQLCETIKKLYHQELLQ